MGVLSILLAAEAYELGSADVGAQEEVDSCARYTYKSVSRGAYSLGGSEEIRHIRRIRIYQYRGAPRGCRVFTTDAAYDLIGYNHIAGRIGERPNTESSSLMTLQDNPY